ncbi:uncharacterized protein HaLaN_20693, partial [Haematococcus lacustris]
MELKCGDDGAQPLLLKHPQWSQLPSSGGVEPPVWVCSFLCPPKAQCFLQLKCYGIANAHSLGSDSSMESTEPPRKLAVLGLPWETSCAQQALAAEHTIDGRRCEAKVAVPKGDPMPPRTTRIFVARIPSTVTELQFPLRVIKAETAVSAEGQCDPPQGLDVYSTVDVYST